MITRKLKTYAVASCLLLASGGAMATTLTNTDGSWANWGGFDWASAGTAVVDGFDPTVLSTAPDPTSTFTLYYFASAVGVTDTGGNVIGGATAGLLFGDYEYTILATLNETSTCTADNGSICTSADFQVNNGDFQIYYDTNVNSNQVTGAGMTDGIQIIDGAILAQAGGGFNVISGGNATLLASNLTTNLAYIKPSLDTSTATTTLQIGTNVTNWTAPTGMPGAGGSSQSLPNPYIALQADGNQSFTSVPEPATVGLLGLGLTGMALVRRRRKQKA